jgi:hypothetical protein
MASAGEFLGFPLAPPVIVKDEEGPATEDTRRVLTPYP